MSQPVRAAARLVAEALEQRALLSGSAPYLAITPGSIDEGGLVSVDGAFRDVGVTDTHTVSIDWGDGSSPQLFTLPPGVLSFTGVTHQYADSRTTPYDVTANVIDGAGVTAVNFASPVSYGVNTPAGDAVTADFNADGIEDLAIGHNAGVSVLLGLGGGQFGTPAPYPVLTGERRLTVADLNNDGAVDLVSGNLGNFVSTTNVGVLLGNGDGTFRSAVSFNAGPGPLGVATGDFNGDESIDVVAANRAGSTVTVLLGNGDGTLRSPLTLAAGSAPTDVAVADFNGDGRLDIASANLNSGTVSVFRGNGNGTFQSTTHYAVGGGPNSVIAADLNHDGRILRCQTGLAPAQVSASSAMSADRFNLLFRIL